MRFFCAEKNDERQNNENNFLAKKVKVHFYELFFWQSLKSRTDLVNKF